MDDEWNLVGDADKVNRIRGILENAKTTPGWGAMIRDAVVEPESPDPYEDLGIVWGKLPKLKMNRALISATIHDADTDEVEEIVFVAPRCPKCLGFFLLGVNGTVNGCDVCCGVKRDLAGHWWDRHERFHHYGDEMGTTKVSRRLAFAYRNPRLRHLINTGRILAMQGYVPDEGHDTMRKALMEIVR